MFNHMKQKFPIIIGIVVLLVASYFYLYPKLIQPPKPTEFKDVIITLERTACYGFCPAYKLTIYGDGKIVYDGKYFVKTKGVQNSQIPTDKVKGLVDEFYKIDYFSLQDKYYAPVTDLPTTTTAITIDGKTKKVVNYYGAPEKLSELENIIDEITNSKKWIGKCTSRLDETTCE